MNRKKYACLSLILLLAACSKNGNDQNNQNQNNNNGCVDACDTDGASQCGGEVIQTCEPDADGCLVWVNGTDCAAADQACDEGTGGATCIPDCVNACAAEGDSQCSGTTIQSCLSGPSGCLEWVNGTDCDLIASTCDDGGVVAECVVPCADVCVDATDTQCSGAILQTCVVGAAGCTVWEDATDCSASDEICDASTGDATCAPTCSDTCPNDGDSRCSGSAIQSCTVAGSGCLAWIDGADCAAAGNVCNDTGASAICVCVPACSSNTDCDDNDALTDNICSAPGTCSAACSNPPFDCVIDADCDDVNECTTDACNANTCEYTTACPGGVCASLLWHCPDENGYLHPHLRAAITRQIVALDGLSAEIEIQSLLTFPYVMDVQSVDLPNALLGVLSLSETGRICGTNCRQYFTLILDTSDPAVCELDGAYTMHFTYSCDPAGDCSLIDPSYTTEQIDFSLNSENFCGP